MNKIFVKETRNIAEHLKICLLWNCTPQYMYLIVIKEVLQIIILLIHCVIALNVTYVNKKF